LDDSAAALSVAAALEQGIQLAFQLDGSELGSYVFEDDSGGARVLLYETDEGGIGVLAALGRGESWERLVITTLRALHVDPETGEEREGACITACYDCLLTFYNQQHHRVLDRRPVVELLLGLRGATFTPESADKAGYDALLDMAQGIEGKVLARMRTRGFPAPPAHHHVVTDNGVPLAESDLYYPDQKICVMCDGPPHDEPGVAADDAIKRKKLKARGYRVVVVHYADIDAGLDELGKRLGY
jgi:hypothetical protein